LFGQDIYNKWNHLNKLKGLVRSHTYEELGYSEAFDNTISTVFSANNYGGLRQSNFGAVVQINSNLSKEFKVYINT